MSLLYITQENDSGFLNITPKDSILDYRDSIEHIARNWFAQNPGAEFFSICVVDFGTNKSVIYEFQHESSISCTVY